MSTQPPPPPPPPPGYGGVPPVPPAPPMPTSPTVVTGPPRAQVHDVRFSGYEGERAPAWQAPVVLAWWSMLRAFGRRRGWSAKFIPFSLLGMAFIPGLGVLTVRALMTNQFPGQKLPIDLLPYSAYLGMIGTLIVLWTALVTPELVCPDIQHRVTTLYFATAVSPMRYVLGKCLASLTALLGMTLLPVLVLWMGNVLFAPSIPTALADDASNLPRIFASGVIVAVFFSALGLAVAALTGRRAYAIGALVGLVLGSVFLAGILHAAGFPTLSGAVNLVAVPIELAQRLFTDNGISVVAYGASYLTVVALSVMALLMRFRVQP